MTDGGMRAASSPLFCIGFAAWLVCAILGTTHYYALVFLPYLKVAGMILIVGAEALHREVSPGILALCVAAAGIAWANDLHDVSFMILVAYCARHQDLRRIVAVGLAVELCVLLLVFASSQAGLIPNVVFRQADRLRYALGFDYPSFPAHYCLNIMLMWAYLRRKRGTFAELALLVGLCVYVYAMTLARMPFVLTMLFAVVFCAYKLGLLDWLRRIRGRVSDGGPRRRRAGGEPGRLAVILGACPWVLLSAVSLLLLLVDAESGAGAASDAALTGRIGYAQDAFARYGISLLGQPIEWKTFSTVGSEVVYADDYLYVDNSFLHLLVQGGVVLFGLSLWLLTRISLRASLEGDLLLVAELWVFALHSFFDPQMLDLQYSWYLLLLAREFGGGLWPRSPGPRRRPSRGLSDGRG